MKGSATFEITMSTTTCGRRKLVKSNAVNWYAVIVLKDDTILGHLPKTSARIYSLFLRRGGVIQCHVAKYSDIPRFHLGGGGGGAFAPPC